MPSGSLQLTPLAATPIPTPTPPEFPPGLWVGNCVDALHWEGAQGARLPLLAAVQPQHEYVTPGQLTRYSLLGL